MRVRKSVASGLLLLLMIYAISPYVALWRLKSAIDSGDVSSLEAAIDWRSVRDGIKQDIADGIIGPVDSDLSANTLPAFGASFMAGIAGSSVDHDFTPQNIVTVMRQLQSSETSINPFACFDWAFFESPTRFNVTINLPDSDPDEGHLRLRMELHRGWWMLKRAWIPQDLMERASQRT